jgi:DNA invertase Pin-like site-specific DNA recombinase
LLATSFILGASPHLEAFAVTTRRAAIYVRVSTTDQQPEAQLHPLREYTTSRGFNVVDEFIDHGVSGTKDSRPALDRMMAAARRRDLDVIVVAKLDRLARSVRHLVNVAEELQALGVDLVVRDQSLDTSTPTGRLLFHVLGSIAEFERDLIRERTQAGLELARKRGKRFGRPLATDSKQRARIIRLRTSGHSLRAIAERVGVGRGTVERVLTAPFA